MPVIFDNGSEDIRTWLDPARSDWSQELQSLLRPYEGELECYQVSKDVGKVGNNSPSFIIPINSAQNKNNIANFFGSPTKKGAKELKQESESQGGKEKKDAEVNIKQESEDVDGAAFAEVTSPKGVSKEWDRKELKRERATPPADGSDTAELPPAKARKTDGKVTNTAFANLSPSKSATKAAGKTRSATSNGTIPKTSPSKGKGGGSQKITAFFSK
jgi:hypothetical protein